ncbi:hypothetical protein [Mycoplasma buteonis]|uniref:hypothetical protein n=1 Tax=Mycoplasma buteonis TaxID=171280 RepID=UPI00055CB0EB|nr:hypothetical protein [Mycoplasma buteonis]
MNFIKKHWKKITLISVGIVCVATISTTFGVLAWQTNIYNKSFLKGELKLAKQRAEQNKTTARVQELIHEADELLNKEDATAKEYQRILLEFQRELNISKKHKDNQM